MEQTEFSHTTHFYLLIKTTAVTNFFLSLRGIHQDCFRCSKFFFTLFQLQKFIFTLLCVKIKFTFTAVKITYIHCWNKNFLTFVAESFSLYILYETFKKLLQLRYCAFPYNAGSTNEHQNIFSLLHPTRFFFLMTYEHSIYYEQKQNITIR